MSNIIGIDIGGSKIRGVIFDGRKNIRELTIVTPKNKLDFIYSLRRLVEFLSAGLKVNKIGIGVPGTVDSSRFMTTGWPNMQFLQGIKFKDIFPKYSLKIDNDANCSALAEMELGLGKTLRNFVVLTLGTGIGSGMVLDRRLFRGSRNKGGEWGHIILDINSGKTAEQLYQQSKDNINFQHDYRLLSRVLGVCCANIYKTLEPEAIILAGGVTAQQQKKLLTETLKVTQEFMLNKFAQPKILISRLKFSGALGAALLHSV